MIRNYITVALRNLAKNKIYVVINTLGMGIALACCLTAYLLIAYNVEFDDSFKDEELVGIVKVMNYLKQPNGETYKEMVAPIVMAPLAAEEIAGIEQFTRFCNQSGAMGYRDKTFFENIRFADASFFEMFKLGLKRGSYKNFQNQDAIFISEQLSKKYFGDEDPVGKTLTVEFGNTKFDVIVGGVLAKIPLNSSFEIPALMRIEKYLKVHRIEANDWGSHDATVLFKLADINQRQKIAGQLAKYTSLRNQARKESTSSRNELLPFREIVTNDDFYQTKLRHPIPFVALLSLACWASLFC